MWNPHFLLKNKIFVYLLCSLYFCMQYKIIKMNKDPKCPKCLMENTYFDSSIMQFVCPDCGHEFSNETSVAEEIDTTPRDSNGSELLNSDSVTLIKDLKVRGSSLVLKRGTKVKSIRLTENHEEVDCKIDGTSLVLKTCFLKKG